MSDIHFINTDKSNFQNEYFKVMDKRFEQAREKNVKNGNGELTLEAFLDKEELSCDHMEKIKFIYFLLPMIMPLLSYPYIKLTAGFDTTLEFIISVCVLLILSSLIGSLFYKNIKKSLVLRKAWIKSRRDGIKESENTLGESADK